MEILISEQVPNEVDNPSNKSGNQNHGIHVVSTHAMILEL